MDASGLETCRICIHENAPFLLASFAAAGGRPSDNDGNERSQLTSTQLKAEFRHVH